MIFNGFEASSIPPWVAKTRPDPTDGFADLIPVVKTCILDIIYLHSTGLGVVRFPDERR
jgi:hypothetical protein